MAYKSPSVDNSVNWLLFGIAGALLFFITIIGMANFNNPRDNVKAGEEVRDPYRNSDITTPQDSTRRRSGRGSSRR